jgi:trigger factor
MEEEKESLPLKPKYELVEVGPCKYKLNVEVSLEKVKERIEERYASLSKEVILPGFRKGRVPRRLIQRKFSSEVLEDVKGELLLDSFNEVKKEKNFEEIGAPEIDYDEIKVKEDTPFSYEMTFEVQPKFDLPQYKGIKVKKPKIEVQEQEVENFLQNLRLSKAEYTPTEDAVVKEGDLVICDYEVKVGNDIIDKLENFQFIVGEKLIFEGVAIPDAYKNLLGKKVNEDIEVSLLFPESHHNTKLSGKEIRIKIRIKAVKRKVLPEVNDIWANEIGFESLANLKEHIKKDLVKMKEENAKEDMVEQILEHLLASVDIVLPESLIKISQEDLLKQFRLDLASLGKNDQEIEKEMESRKTESRDIAIREIKKHFILEKIGDIEKIYVTEDEVDERVSALASQLGRWPHEIRDYLEKNELLSSLRRKMRNEKIKDALISYAEIEQT